VKATTINLLQKLLDNGSVTASSVSRSAWDEILPMLSSGALRKEKTGAGSRLSLADRKAVAGQLERVRPNWTDTGNAPPRASAVRKYRDSKRAISNNPEPIYLRSCRESCVWSNGINSLDVADLTRIADIAAIATKTDDQWHSDAPIGLIENKEVFFHCERLYRQVECGSFIYYGGNVPKRMNEWLAARERAPLILLYADYDPVGLNNYLRLKQKIGAAVEFVVPPNFEELMEKWGKHQLLEKNVKYLRYIEQSEDVFVKRMVNAMQKHGCGLEQEILLTCS